MRLKGGNYINEEAIMRKKHEAIKVERSSYDL